MARLSDAELNEAFLAAMGDTVSSVVDRQAPVLEVIFVPPYAPRVRVYLYNATNPSGGRVTPEHKIQLMVPGQAKGQRANFDRSGGYDEVLLIGKVENEDAFILWDADLHADFTHSSNVQVRSATVDHALTGQVITVQERQLKRGMEQVLVAPANLLRDAVLDRLGRHDVLAADSPLERPSGSASPFPSREPSRSFGGRPKVQFPASAIKGMPYVRASAAESDVVPETRVFEYDPDALDRGTRAHMALQNQLAALFEDFGLKPLSPAAGDPAFDLACRDGALTYVLEVKSLTSANEEKQLRLGLGQVLSYAHRLRHRWETELVQAVLAVEHEVESAHWRSLCARHEVILTWPDEFPGLFT